jgi:hypothetical protein
VEAGGLKVQGQSGLGYKVTLSQNTKKKKKKKRKEKENR